MLNRLRTPRFLFPTIMAFIMSGVISLVNTILRGGFAAVVTWPANWLTGFLIAWPVAYFVVPVVRNLVDQWSVPPPA